MTSSDLDLRLMRFRSRGDERPHLLAGALIDAGRSQDALEVIHLGLLGNEADAELATLEGRALYEQGELHEAQSALVRAAKADPHNKEPYRWLGQVLIERGDPTRAVQVLERALNIDPHDGSLRNALARAQRLAQREAGRRAPSSPPAARTLGGDNGPSPKLSSAPSSARAGAHNGGSARPANQNARSNAPVGRSARASEAVAEALSQPDEPREARTPQAAQSAAQALMFDDEVERDDESPTTAVEVPEEVRSWLRGERPSEARPGVDLGGDDDDDDDDDDSEATSIVPAAEELELLRYQAAQAESELSADRTMIDDAQPFEHGALARPGEAEPPEQVLSLLERQGVFEPKPAGVGGWARGSEVQRPGGRVTRALGVAWLLALLAAVAGYYGFDAWLAKRREDAQQLVAAAEQAVFDGQHEALVAAEQKLLEARALDPKSKAGLDALLFVQTVRALDGAPEEFGPVRDSLARAQQAGLSTPLVAVASVLAKAGPLPAAAAEEAVATAEREGASDARTTYLAARLAERAGRRDRAAELLDRASAREPRMALAHLSRGELSRGDGELERARTQFEQALGGDHKQLRAELWLMLLAAGPLEARELPRQLDGLKDRIARGSPAEQLLAASVRAFALLAAGDAAQALTGLRAVSSLRAGAPEPLALYAEQVLRAGDTALAYRAVRMANEAGGSAARYQTLLAAVLLQQGAGDAALSALGNVGEGQGALSVARANAALLTDARDALEQAKKELASYRASAAGKSDPDAASLLMRVDMRLGGNAESLLPAARALAQRSPDSPSAHIALAEVLVRAEHGAEALGALEPALRLAPGSPDVHYLVGSAQRLVGRPSEARASFERAVAIAPNHLEARRALGRMLLDLGEYDAALSLYRGLEPIGGDGAKLGTLEALIGKGNRDEASARATGLSVSPGAASQLALLRARLELLRGQPQVAVEQLAPLVDERAESRNAELLVAYGDALYASGKVDPAAQAYEGALEFDGEHPDALIGRAAIALQADRPDQALGLAQRAEAELARRVRPRRTLARLLVIEGRAQLAKGQLAPARAQLARATAIPEATADAHFWYAEVLARLRDPSAVAHYTKYVELAPTGPLVARAKRALAVR